MCTIDRVACPRRLWARACSTWNMSRRSVPFPVSIHLSCLRTIRLAVLFVIESVDDGQIEDSIGYRSRRLLQDSLCLSMRRRARVSRCAPSSSVPSPRPLLRSPPGFGPCKLGRRIHGEAHESHQDEHGRPAEIKVDPVACDRAQAEATQHDDRDGRSGQEGTIQRFQFSRFRRLEWQAPASIPLQHHIIPMDDRRAARHAEQSFDVA